MFNDFVKVAIEAVVTMSIVNGVAFYVSRKGLAVKLLLISSAPIAASFLLGIMFTFYGFNWITAVAFFVISMLVSLAFIWAIVKWLVNPLNSIAKVGQKISNGNLDTNCTLSFSSKDEVGMMVDSVGKMIEYMQNVAHIANQIANGNLDIKVTPRSDNDTFGQSLSQMVHNLNELIGNLQLETRNVAGASVQLSDIANQTQSATLSVASTMGDITNRMLNQSDDLGNTANAIHQMSEAISDIANGAQTQSHAVHQSTALTAEITRAINQIANNTEASAQGASDAAHTAHLGAQTVEETVKGMARIKQAVGTSAERVQAMGEQSAKIGDIIQTIDEIAAQTNLLALNAAIEAARAGEHGKGFAVVADEVRKLAEKSTIATQEIADLITAIQQVVSEAVSAMDESTQEIENGTRYTNESRSALRNIINAVEKVNSQVDEIAVAAKGIGVSADNLGEAMATMADVVENNSAATEEMAAQSEQVLQNIRNVSGASEENSRATSDVNKLSQNMYEQIETVNQSAQSLENMVQSLKGLASRFTVSES